jgi:MtN3 and saliva related transmembrane protein
VDAVDIFGPIASFMGVLMSLSPLFQVRRVLDRRLSDDVSIAMPIVIAAGAAAWIAYGIAGDDIYLIVPNVVGVITNVTSVIVVHRYRRRVDPAGAQV